jgi:uncharacterized protein
MAMTMTGEATLPADRPKIWAMLNDPEVLKACIPGCQSLEKTSDTGFAAVVKVKIGPVAANFKGKVELSDLVPTVSYRIAGEGEGGVAGFAKGGAKVSLADTDGGTLLRYDVEAQVGGKMAQLGSRLIDGVAKNMADKFFANFAAAAGGGGAPAAEPPKPSAAAAVASAIESPTPARFASAAETASLAAPAEPVRPAVGSTASANATASQRTETIPTKKPWFRRVSEWFMSR